eukprot:Platyproteum_vivax@DN1899_c0_g1_i1.p1
MSGKVGEAGVHVEWIVQDRRLLRESGERIEENEASMIADYLDLADEDVERIQDGAFSLYFEKNDAKERLRDARERYFMEMWEKHEEDLAAAEKRSTQVANKTTWEQADQSRIQAVVAVQQLEALYMTLIPDTWPVGVSQGRQFSGFTLAPAISSDIVASAAGSDGVTPVTKPKGDQAVLERKLSAVSRRLAIRAITPLLSCEAANLQEDWNRQIKISEVLTSPSLKVAAFKSSKT